MLFPLDKVNKTCKWSWFTLELNCARPLCLSSCLSQRNLLCLLPEPVKRFPSRRPFRRLVKWCNNLFDAYTYMYLLTLVFFSRYAGDTHPWRDGVILAGFVRTSHLTGWAKSRTSTNWPSLSTNGSLFPPTGWQSVLATYTSNVCRVTIIKIIVYD